MMTPPTPVAEFPVLFWHDRPIIKIPERLTVIEAVNFKKSCHRLLERAPTPQKIFFDFENTNFIDSSGVGALVHNFKAAQSQNIQIIIQNLNPPVLAVLSMTNLDKVFTIEAATPEQKLDDGKAHEQHLPETHPSVRSLVKRWLDIIGSLVGLVITAILFIPIAIAIKLDSPGAIFFSQTRCGWMGKKFRIWKFRSMSENAEALKGEVANQANGAFFKNDRDPRITRVGRFLRRTSLDEFPQFWNVLKGEMSLVGTRPPTPDEVESYEVPEWQRLNVKPGITGEWQVNGRSKVRNFKEVIQLDLRYQHDWSLRYDLKLILKTLLILFHRDSGAF